MAVCAVTVTVLAVRWETIQELQIYSSSIVVNWIGRVKIKFKSTMIFKAKLCIISLRS